MTESIHLPPRLEEDLERAIDRLTRGAERLGPAVQAEASAPRAIRRILVAIDEYPESLRALAWAAALSKLLGARVTVAHAAQPREARRYALDYMAAMGWVPPPTDLPPGNDEDEDETENRSRRLLDDAVADLARSGVEADSEVHFGPPGPSLVGAAERLQADLVILGSHEHGALERTVLGSFADDIMDHVHGHVLIARSDPPPRALLIGTDGSRASRNAAALGLRLSHAWHIPAEVVYVFDPMLARSVVDPDLVAEGHRAFGELESTWTEPRARFRVEVGPAAGCILDRSRANDCGLVLLGARGVSGLRSLVLGSVAARVAHDARVSVLLVKESPP